MTTTHVAELESIPADECLRLVRTLSVGRFAIAPGDGAPLVVPVNYIVDGEVIVFRSEAGAKLAELRERSASFQVDCIDSFHRTGWSVLLQGVAYEARADQVEHLALAPWVPGRNRWVRLVPTSITGRRIRLAQIEGDPRGYL